MSTTRPSLPAPGAPNGRSARRPSSLRFVGRDFELATLVEALPANRDGRPGLCLIAGEPGIGKTRLAFELARVARASGHRVVGAQCWDEAGTPSFWPWTQVVREIRRQPSETDLARLVLPEGAADDRFELFAAAAGVLYDAARRKPLVVILDDLHRSDPASILFLRFVVAHGPTAPLLVVGTYRPDDERNGATAAERLGPLREVAEEIGLDGLAEDAVRELLGRAGPVDEVHALTAGNPLYIEQVVRSGRRSATSRNVATSDGLRSALSMRLGQLDQPTLEALAALAVLGPRADADRAAALLDSSVEDLRARLAPAAVKGMVTRDGLAPAHPLITEAAVAWAGPELGERLHRAAAELAARDGSPAEQAYHLGRAGPGVWREAVRARLAAAESASAALAHEDAVAHHQRALALLDQHPAEAELSFEVTFALAGALERASGRVPAEDAYAQATDAARRSGDPVLVARAAARHTIQYYFGGDIHLVRIDDCRRALAGLPPGDSELRARLLANLAAAEIAGGPSPSGPSWGRSRSPSHAMATEAVAMARRVDDPLALGVALVAMQVTDLGPSTLSARLDSAREILALAEICADQTLAVHGRFLLKAALLERGDVRELDAQLLAQHDLIDRIAEPRFARHWLWFRCMRAMLDGDPDQVEALAEACYAIAEELEDPDGIGVYFGQLGVALWLRGRLAEMEPGYLDRMRAEPHEPLWPGVLAWIAVHDGRLDAARGLAARFAAPDQIGDGLHTLLTLFTMADVAARLDDEALMASLWDAVLPYAEHVVPIGLGAGCFGVMARPLANLALRLGRVDEALAHFHLAINVASRLGAQPWIVDAQLALAEALVALGRGADAQVHDLLREASTTMTRLGLVVFDERVAALRAAASPIVIPAGDGTSSPGVRATPPDGPIDPPAMAPQARIRVLGSFEVVAVDGSTPRWTSRKARSLLKILVARRGVPVSRDQLMDLLWPGEDPAVLGNRLSVALSVIRRALDPQRSLAAGALIAAEGDTLRLVSRHLEIDVESFLHASTAARERYRHDDPNAGRSLRDALAWYRGEALADEPYAPWAEALRNEATSNAIAVLRALGEISTACAAHLDAADAFRRLIELDGYDVAAHVGLITALEALGAHGQANAAHQRYVEAMATIGIDDDVVDPRHG